MEASHEEKRFTEELIIGILKEPDAGMKVPVVRTLNTGNRQIANLQLVRSWR